MVFPTTCRETLLGCTEVQLETRAVQVGYWARVNGALLSGPRGAEVRRGEYASR